MVSGRLATRIGAPIHQQRPVGPRVELMEHVERSLDVFDRSSHGDHEDNEIGYPRETLSGGRAPDCAADVEDDSESRCSRSSPTRTS